MKIAGVTYGQVQTMGRRDVGAPIREAAAEEQASSAWSNSMRQGLDTADKILDDIAIDKSTKAMNVYNERKLQWQADNKEMTAEERAEAVSNGDVVYNDADDAARAESAKVLNGDTRAQFLFDRDADRANVQYGANWNNQVVSWHKDEQRAEANKQIDHATQTRDFDAVDGIINKNAQRGLFNRVQTEKLIAVNDANRVNSSYLTAIDSTRTINDHMTLRKQIKTEPKLTDEARTKMSLRLDNKIIENNGDELRGILTTVEENLSLNDAVVAGDEIIHQLAMAEGEEDDGFASEAARQKARNSYRSIWNEWKARLTKKTKEQTREEGLACAYKGTCLPTIGKTDDQQKHDDVLGKKYGWSLEGSKDYKRNGVESGIILANNQEGLRLRAIGTQDFREDGYVAKPTRETLDAGYTSNDMAIVTTTVDWYKTLAEGAQGSVVAKQSGVVPEFSDVSLSFPSDVAANLIMKYKAISTSEKIAYEKDFDEQKLDDSDFATVVKANMPHIDGGFLYFDATPDYQRVFKRNVDDKARALHAITGGDIAASYKAAMNIVSKSYNTDQNIGRVVKNPIATSVFGGNVDDGKWATDEMKVGIAGYNNGVVPDTFTYEPLPDFHPIDNPKYIVSWLSEEGEYKAIGYEARFQDTERGKEYFAEQNDIAAENERQQKLAVDKQGAMRTHEAWMNSSKDARSSIVQDKVGESLARLFGGVSEFTEGVILPSKTIESHKKRLK